MSDVVVENNLVPPQFLATYIGPDPHTMSEENKYTKTHFYGCLGPLDAVPARLGVWEDPDGGVHNPPKKMIEKHVKEAPAVSDMLLRMAVAMCASTLKPLIPEGTKPFIGSKEQALEGEFGEASFSTRTSPGGKYVMEGITKSMIVKRNADESLDFSTTPQGPRFMNDLDVKYQQTIDREIGANFSSDFGKAEVLPRDKVYKEDKLRLVCSADADYVITDKRVFMCLNSLMKDIGLAAGLCFGMDPSSYDAHLLATLLRMFNNITPGDVSGWDSSFFRYKYQSVLQLTKFLFEGISEEHFSMMETCVARASYVQHIAHIRYIEAVLSGEEILSEEKFIEICVYYEWFKSMISGSYLTYLFNSLGHMIETRYDTLCLFCKTVLCIPYLNYDPSQHGIIPFLELEKRIVTIISGDDSGFSRSKELYFITFEEIKWIKAKHNTKFTAPSKDGKVLDNMTIDKSGNRSEFTFCKSGFVYNHRYNRFTLAPDIDSLKKMLYWSENHLREYQQVIDDFFKGLSKWGVDTFYCLAPNVIDIAWRKYRYRSPYSDYELAIAAAIGGLADNLARKIAPVFDDRFDSPDSESYKDCINLLQFLETVKVSHGTNSPLGLKLVTIDLIKKIEMAESKRPTGLDIKEPLELSNDVFPAMDQVISKEELLTTTMLNDGETKEESESKAVRRIDEYSHEFSDITDFLRRPRVYATGVWDTTQPQGRRLYAGTLEAAVTGSTVRMNKLKGYNLVRFSSNFELQINANTFQQGALRILIYPFRSDASQPDSWEATPIQWTQMFGETLNCRDTKVTISVPFVLPTHYFNIASPSYTLGNVEIFVLAPLKTEPSVGSQTVDWTLWSYLTDVEVAAPCVAAMDRETKMVSERPISTALKAAGKVAGALGSIPPLATHLKPLAWSLDSAAQLAYTLGYSKPLQNDKINMYVEQSNRYSAVAEGPDIALELGISSNNAVVIEDLASYRPGVDEMSFAFLKQVESLFRTLTIDVTTDGTSPITTINLSPLAFANTQTKSAGGHTANFVAYTPAGHISTLFNQWRGGIRLKFQAIKTQLVTCRISIQYNVVGHSTAGVEDSDFTAPRYIWDFASSDEITIDCPWLISQNYLAPTDVMGNVTLTILNELKAPSSTADSVDILCWVSFLPDFELEQPTPIFPTYVPTLQAFPASDSVDQQIIGNQKFGRPETKYAEIGVGEHFNSIKQILSRYNRVPTTTALSNAVAVNPYFFSASTFDGTTGLLSAPLQGGDTLSYVGLMYAAYRGGMKVGQGATSRASWTCSLTANPLSTTNFVTAESSYTAVPWTNPSTAKDYRMNVGITTTTSDWVYVKVPYYVDTLFSMVLANINSTHLSTYGDTPIIWANMYSTAAAPAVTRAIHDDFVFSNFKCTPLLMTSYT